MAEKRQQSRNQLRNMKQYRSLTDEEFDKMFSDREKTSPDLEEFEARIAKKLQEFSQDYDIDDLKINDKETLRAFIQTIIALEDYERFIFNIRNLEDISQANVNVVDRVSKIMSDLRKDMSRFQQDLNIDRRTRKTDKESSVISYIANLKDQARQYFESKMSYILCPECSMLLATVWVLYPESDNKITLKCSRILNDGSLCGKVFTVTSKELAARHGTNKPESLPESLL